MEAVKETVIQEGYVIQYDNGLDKSYYEVNGLGDWSLSGFIQSAALFTEKYEAEDCINEILDETEKQKVKIVKLKSRFDSELSEA